MHSTADLMRKLADEQAMLEADLVELIWDLDHSKEYYDDGHRTLAAAVEVATRRTRGEAHRACRVARALALLPRCMRGMRTGTITVAKAREISRAYGNPRARQHLTDDADVLFERWATRLDDDDFKTWISNWINAADPDGADHHARRDNHDRRASLFPTFDKTGVRLEAEVFGMRGAAMAEIFDRFENARFQSEWAQVRAEHGDHAHAGLMPCTATQRAADALWDIFNAAASAPPDSVAAEPLVHVVIDQQTLEETINREGGGTSFEPHPSRDNLACHSNSGMPLAPSDALAAALSGRVRAIVVDAKGVVTDAGRKRRLITRTMRELLNSQQRRCQWPGCHVSETNCQADHVEPHASGGATSLRNLKGLCGRHNRFKETGWKTWIDDDGNWHLRRPDGTELN